MKIEAADADSLAGGDQPEPAAIAEMDERLGTFGLRQASEAELITPARRRTFPHAESPATDAKDAKGNSRR